MEDKKRGYEKYDDRLPLKSITVVFGFDQKGNPFGMNNIQAHDNRRILALGIPVEKVVMQNKNVVTGEIVVTEVDVAKALFIEYTPLAIVEPAPPVEGGAVSPEVPEVSVV